MPEGTPSSPKKRRQMETGMKAAMSMQ